MHIEFRYEQTSKFPDEISPSSKKHNHLSIWQGALRALLDTHPRRVACVSLLSMGIEPKIPSIRV
jgi:hypothetical protein